MNRLHRNRSGFSLIELVFTVVIIGITASIAVPNILARVPNMRLKSAARDLYSNIMKAKVEAVKRNQNVVIAITAVNCAGLPNNVPVPGGGYTIFVDDGGSGGGIAGNNIQDGNEFTLASVVMPAHVALCTETFGGNTGFVSSGLLINNNIGSITLNNDKGRSHKLNITIAGGVSLQ